MCPATPSSNPKREKRRNAAANMRFRCKRSSPAVANTGGRGMFSAFADVPAIWTSQFQECPHLAQCRRLYTMPVALVTVICKRLSAAGALAARPRSAAPEGSPMSKLNHKFELAARPVGMPKRTDWTYKEEPVREPAEGELLIKILYISLDPAMRGWMNEGKSYIAPVEIGAVMRAGALGRVTASKNRKFAVGDYVYGAFGVQEFAISNGNGINKIIAGAIPLPVFLGTLGMPGMTAYFGLLDIGQPKPGETVVVSGAAGAVGTVVGQIAKIKGCKAVGIAGGVEKCNYIVKELGFDAAIDYKSEDLRKSLRQHCPNGIDVYFDNVEGIFLTSPSTN